MFDRTSRSRSTNSHRRGAMLVLVAVTLVILLVTMAFTIDVAYMQLTRTELRTAIDAAARAGAESLSREQSTSKALAAAIDLADDNLVANDGFTLPAGDVEFGRVSVTGSGASVFQPNPTTPNALRIVSGRTTARPDGPVGLFFQRILGRGSFQPIQDAVAAQLDRDMCLVLDRSGSMGSGGRFSGLTSAVNVFLDEIDKTPQIEQVSLVGYSSSASKLQELTSQSSDIRIAFSRLRPRGATAIGLGVQAGVNSLTNDVARRDFAEKTLIVMTDGQHNTSITPESAARAAAGTGITIHSITFGSGAEQERMKRVAQIGGGKHFHAPNNAALIQIFKDIASTLPVVLTE